MFTNKQIGIGLVVLGLVILILSFVAKAKEDFYIEQLANQLGGTCVLDSGYCLHEDRNWTGYIIAWVAGSVSVVFGLYLWVFDKSYSLFRKQQEAFHEEIKASKQKDEFSAFISGFSDEEQKVLKAIKEQDGIKQSTLRYRTGISKASLSLLLNSLEKREIISRKPSGKTKEVYLRKRF